MGIIKQLLLFFKISNQSPYQAYVNVLRKEGFSGDDAHFHKGDCHVLIMEDRIRLWYNIPGLDKEYIGPPLPTADAFKRFIKENSY